MSSIFPEKIAMYFASMNPLSAKIFADIQAVEETVKIDNNLSYNEKSKIIDKHLIYDVIRRNQRKQHHSNSNSNEHSNKGDIIGGENNEDLLKDVPVSEIFYDDPELDKDHVTALLTSVYPKKPEKYIYDDNSIYLDEHSEPFSYCTQSQAKYCELEKLVKALPLPTSPPPPSSSTKSNHYSKSRIAPGGSSHHQHREKQQAPLPGHASNKSRVRAGANSNSEDQHHGILNHEYIDEDLPSLQGPVQKTTNSKDQIPPKELPSTKTKNGTKVLGIPIMGFGLGPSSTANFQDSRKKAAQKEDPEGAANDDSNLPNQIQNSDLIAELQAKLKRNKDKSNGSALQHTSSIKVNKPKAPPPPPPGTKKIPGTAVKVCEPRASGTDAKDHHKNHNDTKTKVTCNEKGDDNSDVKKSNNSKETTTATTASSVLKSNANAVTDKTEAQQNNGSTNNSSPKKVGAEEFTVDVSSPCRIATPKTGFDFLDNW